MGIIVDETPKATAKKDDVSFTVLEECGVIGTRRGRYGMETIRLDYAKWNDGAPKYELRIWTDRGAGKGIGLTGEQLIALGELIRSMQEEDEQPKATKKTSRKKSA